MVMGFFRRFFDFITLPEEVEATPGNMAKWESRAPGWVICCSKCGLEEPFGKYGIRRTAAGKPRVLMRRPRSRKFSWHRISRKDAG